MFYNTQFKFNFKKYLFFISIIFNISLFIYLSVYKYTLYFKNNSLDEEIVKKLEKNNYHNEYIIITPVTNYTSTIFLKEIYNLENRLYICEKSTINPLCNYRLKKDYGYSKLTYMMVDIYRFLLIDYPNIKMFYKMDDDTLIEKSYLHEFIDNHLKIINNQKDIYFGYPEICPGKRKDKTKPCKQGRLYGMSRDVLNNSINAHNLDIKKFYYRIEDCFMCDIIWTYSNNDNNLLNIDANKNKIYHKSFNQNAVSVNMSVIRNY
jgi:hypothetical protein